MAVPEVPDNIKTEPGTATPAEELPIDQLDHQDGTTPFSGGNKNTQWGPKNMRGGRFNVQDVDPYEVGVHSKALESIEPGEEMTTNELLYRAAVEYMQHMGREGQPVDYETAIKLAAKHYHIPYRPGMVPELQNKRDELDAKLDAAIRARQAERGARKQRQLARTAPTTPEQEKKMQDYWSKNAPQATRVKAPTRSLEEDQQLHVGDPIIVDYPNEFDGMTGEIIGFGQGNKFVIVRLYNHDEPVSMHSSDVKYNEYADDQDEKEFWNGDNEVNESDSLSDIDIERQDLELMNDRQFKVAYGISKVAFRQKYRALLNPAPQQDIPVKEGFQDFNKVEPYAVCLAGKPVKKFDYYEDARRFHDNWKKKLYNQGEKEKADKITLNPIMKEATNRHFGPKGAGTELARQTRAELANIQPSKGTPVPAKEFAQGVEKDLQKAMARPKIQVKKNKGVAEGNPWANVIHTTDRSAEKAQREQEHKKQAGLAAKVLKNHSQALDPKEIDLLTRYNLHHRGKPGVRLDNYDVKQAQQLIQNVLRFNEQDVAEGHADQQRKIFKKNGEPVGEVGIDRESSPGNGQWYMKCYARNIDNAGYDSYEEAVEELKHCMKQGVAEDTGSWIVYDPETRQIKKRFKTHTAGKSYAQTHGLGFASSEYYFDRVKGQEAVAEAETDFSKRRQRERDVDAGRPVKPAPKNPQTDYARKRAKEKRDLEQFGEDEVDDFVKAGGKITYGKPQKGPRRPGLSLASRHIGGGGDRMKPSRTGRAGAAIGGKPVGIKEESSTSSEAVERAVLNRIMVAHTDLLMQFGPDKVMQAAEEVAYNAGDVDEIGTSDVSAYVNQVKQILGAEA